MASREELREQNFLRIAEARAAAREQRRLSKRLSRAETAIAWERTTGNKVRAEFPDGSSVNAGLLFNASYAQGGIYPAVQRDDGQWFLKNRSHQPIRAIDEDEPSIADLYAAWMLVTATDNDILNVRVGGFAAPTIAFTLPFGVGYGTQDFYSINALTAGVTYYFSFRIDMLSQSENDWIISYGKVVVNTQSGFTPPWTSSRTVTLYKVTPAGGEETILTETITQESLGSGNYQYYPAGYGNWWKIERSFLGNDFSETRTLYWNGEIYSDTAYFNDSPTSWTGNTPVLLNVSRTNNYTDTSGVAFVGDPPLISASGITSFGYLLDSNGSNPSSYKNYLVTANTNSFIDGYSSFSYSINDDGVYSVKYNGLPIVQSDYIGTPGEIDLSIDYYNLSGDLTPDYAEGKITGFVIPEDEYAVYPYDRLLTPISFYYE